MLVTRDGVLTPIKIIRISNHEVVYIDISNKKRQKTAPTNFVYMIMREKGNNIFFDNEGNQTTSPAVKIDKKDNVLFTNDGKVFPVYELSIGKNDIGYKLQDKKKSDEYSIAKSDVFMIRNADGTSTVFTDYVPDTQATTQQQPVQQPAIQPVQQQNAVQNQQNGTLEGNSSQANSSLIATYNLQQVVFEGKGKDKRAKLLYCQLGISDGSVLIDDNVKLSFATGNTKSQNYNDPAGFYHSGFSQGIGIQVTVQNLTSKMIFLDLANTFLMRNGESTAYYIPSSTSSTTTTSTGASVNLGAVAGAMGIGGAAGMVANGVTVGGGKTKGTINTVYSQRIISIPPMSTKKLAFHEFFPYGTQSGLFKGGFIYGVINNKLKCAQTTEKIDISVGETKSWEQIDSPQTFGFHLAYSFDETCEQTNSMFVNMFMKSMTGASRGDYMFEAKMKDFSQNWKNVLYFIVSNE